MQSSLWWKNKTAIAQHMQACYGCVVCRSLQCHYTYISRLNTMYAQLWKCVNNMVDISGWPLVSSDTFCLLCWTSNRPVDGILHQHSHVTWEESWPSVQTYKHIWASDAAASNNRISLGSYHHWHRQTAGVALRVYSIFVWGAHIQC